MRKLSIRRTVAGLAAVAAISGALAIASASPAAAAPTTQPTGTPVVLDGVRYNPTDAALRSAGRLHYVVDQQAQKQGVVYAFRTEREALARLAATDATAQAGRVSPLGSGVVEIYSDTDGGGDLLTQGPNTYQGNLTLVGRGCFLWFCNGNWNDVISSVRSNGRAVVLHRDLNLTGPSIYFGSWVSANLTDYVAPDGINWNDQATSLYVYS